MSADNGIYIAKCGEEDYRVIHTGNIENLDFYPKRSELWYKTIKSYYKKAKSLKTEEEAWIEARNMKVKLEKDDNYFFLEYGINYIGEYPILKSIPNNIDKANSTYQKDINRLKTKCNFFQEANNRKKKVLRKYNLLISSLIQEGKITKDEVVKFMKYDNI